MQIGIDTRILCETKKTGLYNYVYKLLMELQKTDNKNNYFLFSHRNTDFPLKNKRWRKIIGNGLTTKISKLWLQTQLGRLVRDKSLDIFWGPCCLLPLGLERHLKTLLTVHDLTYLFFPETMSMKNLISHKLLQKKSIMRADKIITDCRAIADDVRKHFALNSDKIEVVWPGIDNDFLQIKNVIPIKEVVRKYQITPNYVLTVSTIEPRKNLGTVLKVYANLLKRHNIVHDLVIVGVRGWKDSSLYDQVESLGLGDRIHFLGFVPDEDLPVLYAGAKVLLYISLYEGFGFPILEAMACGCPVITSNVASMPQVAGDAALLVDCLNIEQITRAVLDLINNKARRNLLITRGRERVKQFNWSDSAHKILCVFDKLRELKGLS